MNSNFQYKLLFDLSQVYYKQESSCNPDKMEFLLNNNIPKWIPNPLSL